MSFTARLPEWLFKRRRRSFTEEPLRLPSRQEVEDRLACQGRDPLEAASNWMYHVLRRDFEYNEIARAIVVVEVGRGPRASTVYTTHRTDASPVEVRGLLSEAMRGQAETISRHNRSRDISSFVDQAMPRLLEAISGESETEIEDRGRRAIRDALSEDELTPAALRLIAAQVPSADSHIRDAICRFANNLESALSR